MQIKNLQAEVLSLKKEESDTPKAITADLEELRRKDYLGYCYFLLFSSATL